MKSVWFGKALLLIMISVSLFACKDKTTTTPVTTKPIAGKGGLATMRVVMDHNDIYVDSGMVYAKYNSSVKPADNKYDDSARVVMVDGTPVAIFTSLKEGDYFLYGKGWDIIRSKTVYGTRPYTIQSDAIYGTSYLILKVSAL